MTFTTQTTGTADGSDANATTGLTPLITLITGEINLAIDAGLQSIKAGLGNYVWLDANGDGIQNDGSNSGIAGVLVSTALHNGNINIKDLQALHHWFIDKF